EDAKEEGKLIDATYGRKTRSILITDSNHIILSAIQPETIAQRFIESMAEIEKQLERIRKG
ncbi:MAG: extracellular matrix/biofilm biosynthesis regulator RemA family protein, partial [Fervidobacterium sp.]